LRRGGRLAGERALGSSGPARSAPALTRSGETQLHRRGALPLKGVMNNLRNYIFYLILIGWLLLLGIVCVVLISPLPPEIQNAAPLIPFVLASIFLLSGVRVYERLTPQHKSFIQRSAVITMTGALIGNLFFLIFDDVRMIALSGFNLLQSNPQFALLEILFTSCLVAVLSFICGGALAFALLQDLDHRKYSVKSSILKGFLLGVTLGISLCIAVGIVVGPHTSFDIWLIRSIFVIMIAGLVGLWTAWKLGDLIPKINEV